MAYVADRTRVIIARVVIEGQAMIESDAENSHYTRGDNGVIQTCRASAL